MDVSLVHCHRPAVSSSYSSPFIEPNDMATFIVYTGIYRYMAPKLPSIPTVKEWMEAHPMKMRRPRSGSADSLETHDPRDREGQEYRGPKYDEYGRRLYVRFKRRHRKMLLDFLADGPPLPRYMRLRPLAPRLEPDPALFKAIEKMYRRGISFCKCCACRDLRPHRDRQYVCYQHNCHTKFDDFATYLEHQLSAHGGLQPACRRIDQVMYRQEHGRAPQPPLTIYKAHQALEPTYRPIEWSMQRANDEYEAIQAKLIGPSMIKLRTDLMAAYEDIQRGGPARLYRHYRLALEHYESTLKYSIGPRSSHVTTADIAPGRNWFLSVEPEHSDSLRMRTLFGAQPDTAEPNEPEITIYEGSLFR